jgi:N-carbamoyl-L-amino-acid hydrolase
MDLRADAFAGLAEIAAAIPELIRAHGGPQSRLTIGQVTLQPNFPHTIPGRADFSVILRDTDEAVMRALDAALRARIATTAAANGLRHGIAVASWLSPTDLDPGLADLLQAVAAGLGLDALDMPSGAGHDAQTMQAFCPAALVFVPSRGGISHAPEEWTDWPAIEAGAALMLAALLRLTDPRPGD